MKKLKKPWRGKKIDSITDKGCNLLISLSVYNSKISLIKEGNTVAKKDPTYKTMRVNASLLSRFCTDVRLAA